MSRRLKAASMTNANFPNHNWSQLLNWNSPFVGKLEFSSDVFFGDLIGGLIRRLLTNPESNRVRINFHKSENADLHVMLIVAKPRSVERLHRRSQSWDLKIFLQGEGNMSFVSDDGSERPPVGINGKATPVLFTPGNCYHSIEAFDNFLAFLEIAPGPWHPKAIEWFEDERN